MRGYLELLKAEARKRYDAKMTAGAAAADIRLGKYDNWIGPERIIMDTHAVLCRVRRDVDAGRGYRRNPPGDRRLHRRATWPLTSASEARQPADRAGIPASLHRLLHATELHQRMTARSGRVHALTDVIGGVQFDVRFELVGDGAVVGGAIQRVSDLMRKNAQASSHHPSRKASAGSSRIARRAGR